MRDWPSSLPDYDWPDAFSSPGMLAVRCAMACVFHVAYLLGLLVSQLDRRRDRVLIIRTDGLGDALLFEPALRGIANAMPSREIHLWAPQLTCDLLANCHFLHRIMPIPRGFKAGNLDYFVSAKLRFTFGYCLGRWTFDKVIYPAQSPEPLGNWLLLSARAHERWVAVGDTINQFDWQRSRTHEQATRVLDRLPDRTHDLHQNRHLAEQCNAEMTSALPTVHLTGDLSAHAAERVNAWRDQSQQIGGSEIVGIIPAASMRLNAHPNSSWADALRQLWDQRRAVPILLGGPDDQTLLRQLAAELSRQRVPWLIQDDPLGILEMAAVIGELDGVISVDTGLGHISIAQLVPTVVLVGGGNPGRFFPWPDAPHHVALNIPMPCDGCNNRCMFHEAACITLIAPAEIVAAYTQLKTRRIALPIRSNEPVPLRAVG